MTEAVPLVLLPGLLCDHALWRHQVTHLSGRTAVTVPALTGADSMSALAAAVLAAAPPRFALCGLSMGGYVAFEICRQAPERVAKVALLDTSARPDTQEQRQRRLDLIALTDAGRFSDVMPRLLPMLIHPARRGDGDLTATVVAMAERIGPAAFRRQQLAIMNRPDSRPDLGRIACPTLVAGGRQDALTPPEILAEIAGGIPGSRLVVIEECGHLSALERPEAVTGLLSSWLAGEPAP